MIAMGLVTPITVSESGIEPPIPESTVEVVEVVESEPTNNIETEPIGEESKESNDVKKTDDVKEVEEVTQVEKSETIMFKVTAYCPCNECSDNWGRNTATGVLATAGRTIAVDPRYIPYGTKVTINGNTYVAEDCGGAIKGKNRIDIYFDSHQEASAFGVQYLEGVVDW